MEEWLLSLNSTLSVRESVKEKLSEEQSKEKSSSAVSSSSSSSSLQSASSTSSTSGERKRVHSEGASSQEVEMTDVSLEGDSVGENDIKCEEDHNVSLSS